MNNKTKTLTGLGVAAAMAAMVAAPVAAQSGRQKDKNTMRNVGVGLGAAAALEVLRGRGTNALILGAGAAYSGKKYEDARKAQSKEQSERMSRNMYGPIDVIVDDRPVRFRDQGPQMVGSRVYVPLRGVLEKMGANVRWDARSRTVVASHEDRTVRLPANGMATINGRAVELDAPAFVEDGRTMIPLRFMAEAFGADVNWDAGEREVQINSDTREASSRS